jgi:hypothetical protein
MPGTMSSTTPTGTSISTTATTAEKTGACSRGSRPLPTAMTDRQ